MGVTESAQSDEVVEVVEAAWRCWVARAAASALAEYNPTLAVRTADSGVSVETLRGTWSGLDDTDDFELLQRLEVQARRFRPLVRRRIAELDGVAAAVAIVIESERADAVARVRDAWLGAAGSDGRTNHGIVGQLIRDDGGRWLAPVPTLWSAERRVEFDADSARAGQLAGARSAVLGTVNMGLRDATKARRRSRARR